MVEWKKLGDVCDFQNGFAFKSGLFKSEGVPIIRITNITSNNIDMTDCKFFAFDDYIKFNLNPFVVESGDILLAMSGATTGKIGVYRENEKAYLNQRVGKFVPHKTELDNRYLYHFLLSKTSAIYIMAGGGAQPNLSSNKLMEELRLPIPSINQQENIAKTLDTFTSSIDNLKQQIALRRKQYEYYRDQLLDLEGKEGVKILVLETIAEIGTGSSNTQDELEIGKYPFFVRSQIVRWKNEYEYDETAIITSGDGVGVGKVLHYYEGKYALHQRAYRIHIVVEDFVPKFLYYYMQKDFYNYIMLNAYAASVTSVRKPMLLKYPIQVPPLSEQQRIVSILDTFEASIQNLEAQLSQREKQYEYYRNKLLTFE